MRNTKPDNPTAFPYKIYEDGMLTEFGYGMSLRDYFAAKAMAGLMSVNDKGQFKDHEEMAEKCAKIAYLTADVMLKQRQL